MTRLPADVGLREHQVLIDFGLVLADVIGAVQYVYKTLDAIDEKLTEGGGPRLSQLLELANLSAIVGNLFRSGLVGASNGRFKSNAPHTYPDILGNAKGCKDIEIKVALENNNPKGHLVKPGPHLTIRYVLGGAHGHFSRGKENRGDTVWLWEVRVGRLAKRHFNFSNTKGDSGKTAVINAAGMSSLEAVYFDKSRCPLSPAGSSYTTIANMFK